MYFDAILSPPEIDHLPQRDLSGSLCVVFDILRATTSIVTALAHGTEAIRPASSIEEARAMHTEWPDAFLGGERHGEKIEGFDLGNSPAEYCAPGIRRVITTTTNGTIALRACHGARETLVGALVNLEALVAAVRQRQPSEVILVCSGTSRTLSLEDVIAAGLLADAFPEAEWSDAAHTAVATARAHSRHLRETLARSGNGSKLMRRGKEGDVAWCATLSRFDVVGVMKEGIIRGEKFVVQA